MRPNLRPNLVLLCLLSTVAIGAVLRFFLAGSGWLPWDFALLRKAHTHLGWYGAFLPAAFSFWASRGLRTPGPRVMAGYWAAVALAVAGFLHRGYGPAAIAGSTVVLLTWLGIGALNLRRVSPAARDFFAPVPVLLLLAAACVPAIALHMHSDPAATGRWVRTFLVTLLFGAGLPAALDRGRFRPFAAGWWWLAVIATALYLGALPLEALRGGPLLLGVLLVGSALFSTRARADLRLLTGLTGLSLAAITSGRVRVDYATAVAGTHLCILGPMAHGLLGSARSPRTLVGLQHAALLVMVAALALAPRSSALPWLSIAAWAGAVIALLWIPLGLDAWRDLRAAPSPAQSYS